MVLDLWIENSPLRSWLLGWKQPFHFLKMWIKHGIKMKTYASITLNLHNLHALRTHLKCKIRLVFFRFCISNIVILSRFLKLVHYTSKHSRNNLSTKLESTIICIFIKKKSLQLYFFVCIVYEWINIILLNKIPEKFCFPEK